MSPKRLLCAAACCLSFAGAAALAQTAAPAPLPTAPAVTPAAEPADMPNMESSAPEAPPPSQAPAAPPMTPAAAPPRPVASATLPAPLPPAPMVGPVRNVVLVHGALVDGSSWNGVVAQLERKGYHVSSVQNPLTSLADDVAATRRVLARQDGPTMLVGHSWGGVVITEAGANAPNVAGLVYVAAIAPDLHESAVDLMKQGASMPAGQSMIEDPSGFLWFDRTKYRADLAADVPDSLTRVLSAAQQPIAKKALTEKVNHVAWREKPTWYVLTTRDQAVSPELQRSMAERMNAKVTPIASSHLAPVSHAAEIANVIDRAARELSRQQ